MLFVGVAHKKDFSLNLMFMLIKILKIARAQNDYFVHSGVVLINIMCLKGFFVLFSLAKSML